MVLFHVLQSSVQYEKVGDVLDEVDDGVPSYLVVLSTVLSYSTVQYRLYRR